MFWLAGLLGMLAMGAVTLVGDAVPPADADGADDDDPGSDTEVDPAADGSGTVTASDHPIFSSWIMSGTPDADALEGGAGDDQINGYAGNDTVWGGGRDDDLYGGMGDDNVDGGAGDDSLHGDDGNDTLTGGQGNDTLFGHGDADSLAGDDGDDEVQGGDGNDSLTGGAGDDALHGGLGDDTLDSDAGADTLFGGWGDDVVLGHDPDAPAEHDRDYLNGGGDDDTLVAGVGDVLTAGDGQDVLVLGDWLLQNLGTEPEQDAPGPVEIMDYSSADDSLLLVWDGGGPDPEIDVVADPALAGVSHILVNGDAIATVRGDLPLVEDIRLVEPGPIPARA